MPLMTGRPDLTSPQAPTAAEPRVEPPPAPGRLHARGGRRLLLATSNAGKVREIREILADCGWDLLTPDEVGVTPPRIIENGRSYLENAVIKARAYMRASGIPALGEDSGLEVDALGGRPGVHSARYGGPGLTDRKRYERLLKEMEGVPAARRLARFRCTVVLTRPGNDDIAREGVLEGRIALQPRGQGGFGYDPVFELDDGRSLAEIGAEKQRISHRAQAFTAMAEVLRALGR
jgi:XTP/dITP diphosphohydrolase